MRKTALYLLLSIATLGALEASPAQAQCGIRPGVCGQRSVADVIRATGYYNLNASQAAINFETARSMELDNRLKGTQTYFEMRKLNASYRKAEQSKGLTTEGAWRYAQIDLPRRLNSTQLDPVTGKIHWPVILQDPRYDNYRKQLDRLFVLRQTSHSSSGYQKEAQTKQLIQAFLVDLRNNINEYRSDDYMRAKNLIKSLGNEAILPSTSLITAN